MTSGSAASHAGDSRSAARACCRRRWSLYAAGVRRVAIVAKAAIVGIGLPDWVFPASLVVDGARAAGDCSSPATCSASRAARARDADAHAGRTPAPHGTMATIALKASPHLSWRRRGDRGRVGDRRLRRAHRRVHGAARVRHRSGRLAARRGKLSDRDKILVADFARTAPTGRSARVVTEAVRAARSVAGRLASSRRERVPRRSAAHAACRRRRASTRRWRASRAARRRQGGRRRRRHSLRRRIHRLDAARERRLGQELASLSESAGGAKDLIPTIGKLTRELRGKMGESLKHVHASPPLAQVTTSVARPRSRSTPRASAR